MYEISEDKKKLFLAGIRRFKEKGVAILFNGTESTEDQWHDLFRVSEQGGFYRCGHSADAGGCLREIRFDWIEPVKAGNLCLSSTESRNMAVENDGTMLSVS